MRINTRKRPAEPGTPEPRDATPTLIEEDLNGNHEDEAVTEDAGAEMPPPSKKRKADDSPPWKSATTQTPTTFVVDGRRRSGRTNPIPFELMPATSNGSRKSSTRQTRSSAPKSEDKLAKGSSAKSNSRTPGSATKKPPANINKQTDKSTPNSSSRSASRNHRRETSPPPSGTPSRTRSVSTKTPQPKPSPRKPSSGRNAVTYGTRRTSTRTAARAATEAVTARAAKSLRDTPRARRDNDSPEFDSDGEIEVGPDYKPPRFIVKFRPPPLTITHPLHLPPKPDYPSFDAFLDSFEGRNSKEELEEAEEEAKNEAEIRQKVEEACEEGGVLHPLRNSELMPEEQPGPPRLYYHQDHLLAHVVYFQSLMEKERRRHMDQARKVAILCAQEVQKLMPKTEEQIWEELVRIRVTDYTRMFLDLRNWWAQATEMCLRKRRERADELRKLGVKERFSGFLERSERLLKQQAVQASVVTATDDGKDGDAGDDNDDEEGSEDEGTDGDDEEDGDGDEANMSSNSSDGDEDEENDDDANLTVEQLREKYSRIPLVDENITTTELVGSPMQIDGAPEDPIPDLDDVDSVLLDSDEDHSTVMDSELESYGLDSDEDEEAENLYGDFINRGKEDSVPAEDVEVAHADADFTNNRKDSVAESNVVINGIAEAEANGTALTVYSPPQNEHMDIDDATTASTSPVQGKPSVSTTSQTTPQPAYELKTPIPFLLRGTLREYQHYGLEWLAGLYENKTNGILADEMGLGKTIQTIALIAHLACVKEVWGPHLIVVPTSVMLNWEMEFKKWAPGFKILTYYGSREQRAEKRKGWYDDNLWHVCITSYQLVLQDQVTFKRRNWHYLILDEAHNIKNFRSQRWQTLLNFKAEARLLLTGTPLQNNLIELWSLLYFLMPSGASTSMPQGFANLKEFQEWFAHPVDQMIEGGREHMDDEARRTVTKLHQVLRPYLLRRLKADVEKQMPGKYEHIVPCRLSKRQRYLYDDFMSLAKTKETLNSGNYLSIINCLMQLRKVCNHPDLFETRQIVTSFAVSKSAVADFEITELFVRRKMLEQNPLEKMDLDLLNLIPTQNEKSMTTHTAASLSAWNDTASLKRLYAEEEGRINRNLVPDMRTVQGTRIYKAHVTQLSLLDRLKSCIYLNELRCARKPVYGANLLAACSNGVDISPVRTRPLRRAEITGSFLNTSSVICAMMPTLEKRSEQMSTVIEKFGCLTPNVVCTDMPPLALTPIGVEVVHRARTLFPSDPFHQARIKLSIQFPDKRLLQYDCGKLQRLDILLRELQAGGHRALIFTQMTKVLDILEQFLNIHGHRYLRLDGATKVEQRQVLTERFNNDDRILVFILSTRSGGLGINLTGADTVIFYDLDWNPAMDKQCQDRCHRIGQTRDVHIYRFVSEFTIESNILKKANQKRLLDDVVIQEGEFTTDYFSKVTLKDMVEGLNDQDAATPGVAAVEETAEGERVRLIELVEDQEDVEAAKAAQRELVDVDGADFGEAAKEMAKKREDERRGMEGGGGAGAGGEEGAGAGGEEDGGRKITAAEEAAREEEAVGEEEAGEEDDGKNRIEEWAANYVEWEMENLPVLPASKDSKKRRREKSKKGKLYR